MRKNKKTGLAGSFLLALLDFCQEYISASNKRREEERRKRKAAALAKIEQQPFFKVAPKCK